MYDVIIIGGGPGGYAAGIRAAQLGGKVAVVEAAEIGGTCVNRGCIPSKVWLRAAGLKDRIEKAEEFGIKATLGEVDFSAIVARKKGVSGDIQMGMNGLLGNNKIKVVEGSGVIKSAGSVEVEGNTLETKNIIVATGASAGVPDVPGLEEALVSTDDVFDTTEIPASVLVYGSSYIEVEMASLFNSFGSKVYLAFDSPRMLDQEDGDTSQRIAAALREQGVEVMPRTSLQSVQKSADGFDASLSGKEDATVSVEKILVAVREPNTQDIGLEQVGVELNQEGFIQVDEQLKTKVDGIYAIGDVTGGRLLSYAATVMGVTAAQNAMGEPTDFAPDRVPRCLFTTPEAAAVGLSEEEAEEKGFDVEVGVFPMSINGLAICYGEVDGAVKIVSDAAYGEILGVHIVGSHATELIWGACLAMQTECTVEDLARNIVVHPTFSESIGNAAQDAMGWALYLPKR
ncbi:MAG: dihydrolipoyl dehydrogenase [Proteobacteria bacterium]|nr:dihydrolipoyl dehydrogenase [Pseudomonadota bacterium]